MKALKHQFMLLETIAKLSAWQCETNLFTDQEAVEQEIRRAANLERYSAILSENDADRFNDLLVGLYRFVLATPTHAPETLTPRH